jgi:hypothetical protein
MFEHVMYMFEHGMYMFEHVMSCSNMYMTMLTTVGGTCPYHGMILCNSTLIPCMPYIHVMHVMCIWLLLNFYHLYMIIINRILYK